MIAVCVISPVAYARGPSGTLCFKCSQHSPTTRPSVERTAEKEFMLSDRVQLSSVEGGVTQGRQ